MKRVLTGTRLRPIAELGIAGLLMIWMQRSAERQVNDLAVLEGELRNQEDALETQVLELAEQKDLLKQQVQAIEQREDGLSTRINQLEASDDAIYTEHKQQLREAVEAVDQLRKEEASLKQEHSQEIRDLRQQLTQAQAAMPGLCILDSAGQRPSELNSAKERDGWLRETWRALGALHEYAVSEHEYAGDIWRWMKDSGDKHAWHADLVAMHESPTMATYRAARNFTVDTQVEASGKTTMQAHLKIAPHGGQNVPRIFFHDDTTGETGLVHIGFIGPHHLVPVASNS